MNHGDVVSHGPEASGFFQRRGTKQECFSEWVKVGKGVSVSEWVFTASASASALQRSKDSFMQEMG